MERVWVKSKSGAIRQVAESAVRVMRLSGWKPLTKAEVATHEKELAQARQKERDALVRAPKVQDPAPAARAEQDKES